MKKKNKIAVHAELRKESESFNGWFKYEVTIKDVNGGTQVVPAYGKDLQDALSRVVHDEKVIKYRFVFNRVPSLVWIVGWFTVLGGMVWYTTTHRDTLGDTAGLIFLGTITLLTTVTLSVGNWFKLRNTKK